MFEKKFGGAIAVALLCASAALPAAAQTSTTTTTPMAGAYPMNATASAAPGSQGDRRAVADRKFMNKAAASGMAEVEMGKLAQQKASSDRVKQYGARMEADHSKANGELKSIAASKGVELPGAPDKKAHKMMEQLNAKSGAEFDRAYISHMVSDHKKDISLFEKEASSGKDSATKTFASNTLPTLREHLTLAQEIDASLKGSGSNGNRAARQPAR